MLIPCVLRLANGDWFTNRVSAIQVMSAVYDKSGLHKDTLRKKFQDLSTEETPMIRRAIATSIGILSSKMNIDYFMADLMPVFKSMANDDQDGVRVLIIDSLIEISKNLSKEANKSSMIPILIQLTRDRAWQVRKKLSQNFAPIAKVLGQEISDNSLVNIFSILLQDPEGEVRVTAVCSFVEFVQYVGASKYGSISSQVLNLTSDTLPLVRAGAAEVISQLIPQIGKEEVKKKILPHLLEAMKSENDDEVKMELVQAFKASGLTTGQEFFSVVSQIDIGRLMMENNWRVRKATLLMIVELAYGLKSIEVFELHLQEFFFQYLNDPVYSLRIYGNELLPVRTKYHS